MLFNCFEDELVSFLMADSPSVALSIASTSLADLSITLRFKSLKPASWVAVSDNKRSWDLIWVKRDEHTHRRYVLSCWAQN